MSQLPCFAVKKNSTRRWERSQALASAPVLIASTKGVLRSAVIQATTCPVLTLKRGEDVASTAAFVLELQACGVAHHPGPRHFQVLGCAAARGVLLLRRARCRRKPDQISLRRPDGYENDNATSG